MNVLVELPQSSGIRNQVEVAQRLSQAGVQVTYTTEMDADELETFVAHHKVFLDRSVLYAKGRTTVGVALPDGDLLSRLRQGLSGPRLSTFDTLLDLYCESLASNRAMIDEVKPSALFVADDGIAANAIMIAAAKSRGVPVFCCPYGYGAREDLEKDAALKAARGDGYGTASPGGSLVLELFPKWVNTGREGGRIPLPPEVILAREAIGASIDRPWVLYGSDADVFCLPAEQYRDFLLSEGTDPARLTLTGGPTGSLIHETVHRDLEVAAAFRKPRKIMPGRTRVLVALPPSYHADRAHLTEFASYADMVNAVLRPLAERSDVDLTISLHPATQPIDCESLSSFSSAISQSNIFELIAAHDVFVTDFSSTIRWAIASGVPTINYDVYGFALAAYEDAKGVLTLNRYDEYVATIEKVVTDGAFYAELAGCQTDVADYWGVIDGNFANRLMGLLKIGISSRSVSPTTSV